jgi:hypothetical protein
MKKLTIILSILSTILLSQLPAADNLNIVAQDEFSGGSGTTNCPNQLVCKGWTASAGTIDVLNAAGAYSLRIGNGENATKTFFFPTLKTGQSVTVKFEFAKSTTATATLNTRLNNETYPLAFSTVTTSFKDINYTAKLDVDKKLKIDFGVSGGSVYGYIKSVTIIADGVVWIDDYEIEQNTASDVNMTFKVHNPSGVAVEINYKTVPLNAQEGIDYQAVDSTLEFSSGQTEKSISVRIPQHSTPMSEDRRFAVSIESADVRVIDAEAIGTIKAVKGAISIEDAGFIYAGTSGVNSTAVFKLRSSYSVPVSVDYKTVDISAQSGVNYVYKNGTIPLAAGENTTINITVIGNDTLTTQREFKVVLSGAHLTRESAVAVLYGNSNTHDTTTVNTCPTSEVISFLNNANSNVSGVLRGNLTTTGNTNSESSSRKGYYYKFTAGMDARVEITYRALNRTMDFIQSVSVPCSDSKFFRFSATGGDMYYYVLKADQKFDSIPTGGISAGTPLSWWFNPEGAIAQGQLDKRKVEHSVIHVKRGETVYLYAGVYSTSGNTPVTSDYQIEINYLPEVTNIQRLENNGISDYNIVNPIETQNLYGNIKLIGNSFLCITDYDGASNGSLDGFGKLLSNGYLTKPSGELCTKDFTRAANHRQMPYLDMDSDPSTYNSVMAKLSTPAGSKVVWAGLFWVGTTDRNSPEYFYRHQGQYRSYTDLSSYVDNSYGIEKILFKVPGSSNYQEVYAEKLIQVKGNGATMFGAYKNITNIINKEAADGEYWAANFRGSSGWNEIGNLGGWSMVVIYEEDPENPDIEGVFRNLSVFNGFGRVSSNNKIKVSGFLTPKNGDVDAFLHIFAAEGEMDKTGDYMTITPSKMGTSGNVIKVKDNSKYPANFIATHPSTLSTTEKASLIGKQLSHIDSTTNNNVLTGTIGTADRYPITLNGNGIDLKSIDIGEHMSNTQKEFTINFNAGGSDYFYPSMVATSVQLYDPDICYEENVTYNDLPIQAGNLPPKNAIVEYTVTVKHKEHETAEKVSIRKTFIEDYGLDYVTNSIQVRNSFDSDGFVSKGDSSSDGDTARYSDSDKTMRVNIGHGATATEGGWLQTVGNVSDMVEIKYKARLTTNNTIRENVYIVDYSNTDLQLDFKNRPIKKCYDFSITFDPGQPPIGAYRAVNEKFSKPNGHVMSPIDLHSDNALYTQVAGQPFNVKLVFANTGTNAIEDPTLGGAYEKAIELELIEYPNYLSGDDNAAKQTKCVNAVSIANYGEKNITNSITEINNIVVGDAYKEVTFRIKDVETNVPSCSPDRFAVRPAQFNMNGLAPQLIGGAVNNADLTAVGIDNVTITTSYNQAVNTISLGDTTLDLPVTCLDINPVIDPADFALANAAFINGVAAITANYNNVGRVKTGFVDNRWTERDGGAKGDCKVDNASNAHDANGKVGCDITTADEIITFIPRDFRADVTISGTNGGDFVYLSDSRDMAGEVVTALTARLDNNDTATNYHRECFAQNVTYEITLNNNALAGYDVGDRPLGTPQQRIRFFDRPGNAILTGNNAAGNGVGGFRVGQDQFVNGVVVNNVRFDFNFQRSVNEPEEPFIVDAAADFLIENDDIHDADVLEADVNIVNRQTVFFYGRAFVLDQQGTSPINGRVQYEVFCDACVKANFGISFGGMNEKSSRWFLNDRHNNIAFGTIPIPDYVPNDGKIEITQNGVNGNGFEGITFTNLSGQTPYEDTVHAIPNGWLIYNPNNAGAVDISFIVKFIGDPGGWAGRGQVTGGETIGGVIEPTPEDRTKIKVDW